MLETFRGEQITYYVKGVQGISDLITAPGYVKLGLRWREAVMKARFSINGVGVASGENRAAEATKKLFLHHY